MFRHVVLWRMDADDDEGRRRASRRVIELMRPLESAVPSVRGMHFFENSMLPDENADLLVIVDFDDPAGFEEYRVHPEHLACVPEIRSLYRDRMALDAADGSVERGLRENG